MPSSPLNISTWERGGVLKWISIGVDLVGHRISETTEMRMFWRNNQENLWNLFQISSRSRKEWFQGVVLKGWQQRKIYIIGSGVHHLDCSSSNKCLTLEKIKLYMKESGKCKLMHWHHVSYFRLAKFKTDKSIFVRRRGNENSPTMLIGMSTGKIFLEGNLALFCTF